MPIYSGQNKIKLAVGGQKVKKAYLGNQLVYSAGSVVTYRVDTGTVYQEEVDEGASCLSPKTFTPSKSGWTFVGWRSDGAASGTVLTNKVMGDTPVTLYAVFRQIITVTYYNGNTTASSASGNRYYNNGAISNPSFTLNQVALSGWTVRGWSTNGTANSGITYNNGVAFTRDSNVTLFGMYQQTIILTLYNGSSSAANQSRTRYYCPGSGSTVNPTFTVTPATLSGWSFNGWAASSNATAAIVYSSISNTVFSTNATLYGRYSQTITLSYNGNGASGGSTAAQTGTRYWNTGNLANPSFALRTNGFTRTGYIWTKWAMGSAGGTQYPSGAKVTLETNTVFYALWVGTPHYFAPLSNAEWSITDQFGADNHFKVDTDNDRIIASAKGVAWTGTYGYTNVSATIPTGGCTKVRLTVMGLGGAQTYYVYGMVNDTIICETSPANLTSVGSANINGNSITVTLRIVNPDKNNASSGALTEIYFYN